MIVTNEMLENYVIIPDFLREFKISMTAKLIYSVIMTEAMKGKMTDEQGRLYMEISTEKRLDRSANRNRVLRRICAHSAMWA